MEYKSLKFVYSLSLILLALLAITAGGATFIHANYDLSSAYALVYASWWFEGIFILLALMIIFCIFKLKMWRKMSLFILHVSFLVILFASFLTRYYGFDGVMHLKENESADYMFSDKTYFEIIYLDKSYFIPINLSKLGTNRFDKSINLDNKKMQITLLEYKFSSSQERIKIKINFKNINKIFDLHGGHGSVERPFKVDFGDEDLFFRLGSKVIKLPFDIELLDFSLLRYTGSFSPYAFNSKIKLSLNEEISQHIIKINQPLHVKGFRIFQSSYDKDEKGTVFAISYDPGLYLTYLGYFMLFVGFLGILFSKHGRFFYLKNLLQAKSVLLLIFFCSSQIYANEIAKNMGELLVLDQRIKPLAIQADEILRKISNKECMEYQDAMDIFLLISTDFKKARTKKLLYLKNPQIKRILQINEHEKCISFDQLFDENKNYKLEKILSQTLKIQEKNRTKFHQDLIAFDERANIFYLINRGKFSHFIFYENSWLNPHEILNSDTISLEFAQEIYLLINAILQNNASGANKIIQKLKNMQTCCDFPSIYQIKAEILENKLKIFSKLSLYFFVLSLFCLFFAIKNIFKTLDKKVYNFLYYAYLLGVFIFISALILRVFITRHAPFSDTYESLVFIAFCSLLAAFFIFRSNIFALGVSLFLSSIILFVAHLNFINPQITNLAPVLNSYWLSIHVSVITASYGFLSFGAFISLLGLVFIAYDKKAKLLQKNIIQLAFMSEMSIICGLALLSIGTFLGGIWASQSWGRYWAWDPKESWSFVSIVVYSIILHMRLIKSSIYAYFVASSLAFICILMTYFGVNFYLTGLHSYAKSGTFSLDLLVIIFSLLIYFIIVFLARNNKNIKELA